MNTVVFYFTGTGNNYHIAKKIQDCLKEVDIYPFHVMEKELDLVNRYERIIYCVPVYYSHIPPYVSDLLKRIHYTGQKEIITIAGCGGNRGHAIEDMRECINDKGQRVAGEYMLVMPGNYILSYNAFPKWYQSITCRQADRKIKRIVKAIENHNLTVLHKTGLIYKKKYEPRLQEAMRSFPKIAEQYEVSENCMGCGTCARVCPVENIKIVDKRPQFLDNCQQCMACVQWCPNRCIDYKNKAQGRKRYHHSEVTLRDMVGSAEHL